ncbi:MAG: glycosyltransferase [Oscillospiraceae bacterium]|nr:glycosyltransferase [Oscillospiraceae bacterium]
MTICVVCDVLGRENNGTTIAAMNLIRSLHAKGHTVRIVCPDKERKGEPDYFVVPTLKLGPFDPYVRKNGVVIAKPRHKVLEAALDGVDHLHLMVPFMVSRFVLKMARKKGISVTAGFHCQAENLTSHLFLKNNRLANRLVYRNFYRRFYRYVDGVHFPSEFIHGVFERYGGKTNAYVISNGVNKQFKPMEVERPKELEGKRVILFTGRFSKEKSHTVLIDAAKMSRHVDELQLVFAGDGPLKKKLEKRGRGLRNPPIFRFFSREELLRVINSADLYVHPAEIEIEAISCLEAISCGLVPVISNSERSATRFFALSERNLFPCNDSAALAERIDYWLEHPEEKEACSREYLGYTKQFDFDVCMDRMEQMILETYENKHKA